MKTKGELYDFLKVHDGLVFLNTSNEHLVDMAQQRELERIVSYGTDGDAQVQGEVGVCEPFLTFSWHVDGQPNVYEVHTHLVGTYNMDNMLAAIAVGLHFDVAPQQICHALESYQPSNNRSQLEQTAHNWLIVDAYNANPTSMAAALDNFQRITVKQPKMVILGDMRELGSVSQEEHQKVVDTLRKDNFSKVWLVGEEFGKTDCDFRKFKDVEEVKAAIAKEQPQGYYILVKGSNGIKLFQLPELL